MGTIGYAKLAKRVVAACFCSSEGEGEWLVCPRKDFLAVPLHEVWLVLALDIDRHCQLPFRIESKPQNFLIREQHNSMRIATSHIEDVLLGQTRHQGRILRHLYFSGGEPQLALWVVARHKQLMLIRDDGCVAEAHADSGDRAHERHLYWFFCVVVIAVT